MAPEKSSTDTNRRQFLALLPLSGIALLAACSRESAPVPAPTAPKAETSPPAPAAAPAPAAPAPSAAAAQGPMVDEKEAQAIALAYVADAARADKSKIPNYTADSRCKTCALFQGAATDAAGGCPLFVGKRVAAQGVCSAWAKKA
jgi:hypothetical protein